jgi:IS5 family transposase
MKQTDLGLNQTTKRTRKREFLDEMNRVVPWADLVTLVAAFAPEGRRGRPPFAVETMLRIHFMQQWFGLSDPAMEEALHDVPMYREFASLGWTTRLPDESTILRFRHLLEQHKLAAQMLAVINDMLATRGLMLRTGTVVDATLISAPSSTKNASGERRALDKDRRSHQLIDELEHLKASIRAKVEHPFRVIKRQFGFTKVRYRGLKKNTAQLTTLFALSNLWMARGKLMAAQG